MSVQTWREEFYPVEAIDVPKEDALDHSIRKWEGLKPANLEKHGVYVENGTLVNISSHTPFIHRFHISGSNCALCHHYAGLRPNGCHACPLQRVLGESCDPRPDDFSTPWRRWVFHQDPFPMLDALIRAKAAEEKSNATD